ncbi:hypothetical protein BP6252_08576 [Coleophoma cylindrospora]|uniref:Heterokaryon incompatibility domain-containing protein n=1 Tax=Coleophoma cylindrospora TaxID=1849047 RepID=A0A3D8R6D6_9HELO|nr:hypothetical protein BP6252_08576 [Coleophoma cylindrospora]
MDHLPKPIGASIRPQIPFEAEARVYRPSDFVTVPKAYGYEDLDQLVEHGLRPEMDPKEANAFLQEWLYFAFLARMLDDDVDSARDFLYPQTRTVNTSRSILEKKIDEWRQRETVVNDRSGESAQRRYIRASDALAIARRFISKHLSYAPQDDDDGRPGQRRDDDGSSNKAKNEAHESIDPRIPLSIAILGEILQRERPKPKTFPDADRQEFWLDPDLESRRWGYSKYCREQLQNNNWCLSDIRRLESTMPGVCEVYYVSSSKPRRDVDHSSCLWDDCKVPPEESLEHVEGECDGNCGPVLGFDDNLIGEVIKSGNTPLVTYDRTKGKLILHKFDLSKVPSKPFGALSHAWEDVILAIGSDAGGRNSRRIYQCRIRKMQNSFNKLVHGADHAMQEGDVPFYVDVLCYPRQVRAQALALNQMRLVYSKAAEVLVWDRDLLREPRLSDSRMIEMNVKIRLGNWTKSLWTLFEAVLAKRITVALNDETVTFDELRKATRDAKENLYHPYHHVYRAGHPFSPAVYQLRKLDQLGDPKYRPQQVWNAVQFQKIDRVENEAPILAALMKLNVDSLVIEPEQASTTSRTNREYCNMLASKRMIKLLELMNQTPGLGIPSGLIFLPAPKLRHKDIPETKQYGWAARTWLTRQAHPRSLVQPLRTIAITHTNGLLVKFPGLILHSPGLPLENRRFWMPVEHTMHKWLKVVAYPEEVDFRSWWIDASKDHEPRVILSEANPREQGAIGLLVKPKGTLSDGQIQWVDVLCRLWIRLETDREFIRLLCNSFREHPDRALFGTRLSEQTWCVDGVA